MSVIDIKKAAVGKWASINTLLGIDEKHFDGKHGPCPLCGGKDRWRWNKKTEYAHCNNCGSLSGMDLAIVYTGQPFKDLAIEIKQSILGQAKVTTTPEYLNADTDKNKARLERIHKTLLFIGKGVEVLPYLSGRGISALPAKDVFESGCLPYLDEDGKKVGDFKAMVSAFRNVEGELCSYHITYLQGGKKADLKAAKKILPAIRPLSGSAIKLFEPENGVIGVAEGIETALAVRELEGVPMWAAGNAQLMTKIEFPESVKVLHVYGDQDATFTGQQAAYELAKKAALKGIQVFVHLPFVSGDWVTDDGKKYDFLDLLVLKKHESKKQAA